MKTGPLFFSDAFVFPRRLYESVLPDILEQKASKSLEVKLIQLFSFPGQLQVVAVGLLLFMSGCSNKSEVQPQQQSATTVEVSPFFIDVTERSQLNFLHDPGNLSDFEMPQIMSGGGAWVDLDGDQLPDVLLTNGGHPSASRRQLWLRQNPEGLYFDSSSEAGLDWPLAGTGTAVADIDNDGFMDVLLTGCSRCQLWMNNGDGTFHGYSGSDIGLSAMWSTSAVLMPLVSNGLPDLFIANYLEYRAKEYCEDRSGAQDFCGPIAFSPTVDQLLRNQNEYRADGSPSFRDETILSGVVNGKGRGLGVVVTDVNKDGRPDIYVANDMSANLLWMQQPDGSFADEAVFRGVAYNWLGEAEAGMGLLVADLNEDGTDDLLVGHIRGQSNTLYSNNSHGSFTDQTVVMGFADSSIPNTSFGIAAADLNLDGHNEVLIANGKVQRESRVATIANDNPAAYAECNTLLTRNESGKYQTFNCDQDPFVSDADISRGILLEDPDGDGDLDALIINCAGPARLLQNVCRKSGHWLRVRLVDSKGNRFGLGCTVSVLAEQRQFFKTVTTGGGYQTSQSTTLHFGMTQSTIDELRVVWSDGEENIYTGIASDQNITLSRKHGVLNNVR